MSRPRFLPVMCALLLGAADAHARQGADFSGDWSMEEPAGGRGRGAPPPSMGSGWGRTIAVTQTADTLFVEYEFFSRGDLQPPLKFRYALDGSRTTNAVMMGRGIQERTSAARWEGETLVLITTHSFADPATGRPATVQVTRRLSLETADRLRVESTIAGVAGGPPTTTEAIYIRS